MRAMLRVITHRGIAAFFFFAFILMLLWNEIVVGQLGLGPQLGYLQTAGLWFLISVGLSWVGIAARAAIPRTPKRRPTIGTRVERSIESNVERLAARDDWDDLGDRIERGIKRGFAHWVDADEGFDWDDLGELIERKIHDKLDDWVDDE